LHFRITRPEQLALLAEQHQRKAGQPARQQGQRQRTGGAIKAVADAGTDHRCHRHPDKAVGTARRTSNRKERVHRNRTEIAADEAEQRHVHRHQRHEHPQAFMLLKSKEHLRRAYRDKGEQCRMAHPPRAEPFDNPRV
jgi:hypothetical protein